MFIQNIIQRLKTNHHESAVYDHPYLLDILLQILIQVVMFYKYQTLLFY